MNQTFKLVALFTVASFIMLNSLAYGGYLAGDQQITSIEDLEGGAETILYRNDTVTLENTVTEEARPMDAPKPELVNIQTGLSTYYSSNVLFLYIPLGYTITNRIGVNASIPYVKRDLEADGETYTAQGLGDIKIGCSFFTLMGDELAGASKDLQGITYFNVTTPTGDAEAEDRGVPVPLGSGGFSFNLKQTLSKKIGVVRIFGNIGVIYSLPAEYKLAGVEEITDEKGIILEALLGGEYAIIDNLFASLKVNYVYVGEGRQKTGGTWYDSNDALQVSDVVPGLRYAIIPDALSAVVAFAIPVYTKNDPDAEDPQDRNWSVNFSITGSM